MNPNNRIKFLYSYGGRILPRRTDGKLIYDGGFTRVLAVDRSITFSELMAKFGESCGSSMSLRCQLPTKGLDRLVSVTCDEDLATIVALYDEDVEIRSVLFPIISLRKISPPPSAVCSLDFSETKSQPLSGGLSSWLSAIFACCWISCQCSASS